MADWCPPPRRGKTFVASTALLAVAALFAIPALAASTIHGPGDEADKATLDVPVRELISTIEDHGAITPARLLAPRAEAAIEEVFRTDSVTDLTKRDASRSEAEPAMETRLPGVSDDDQSQYKKQMYRRDI